MIEPNVPKNTGYRERSRFVEGKEMSPGVSTLQ